MYYNIICNCFNFGGGINLNKQYKYTIKKVGRYTGSFIIGAFFTGMMTSGTVFAAEKDNGIDFESSNMDTFNLETATTNQSYLLQSAEDETVLVTTQDENDSMKSTESESVAIEDTLSTDETNQLSPDTEVEHSTQPTELSMSTETEDFKSNQSESYDNKTIYETETLTEQTKDETDQLSPDTEIEQGTQSIELLASTETEDFKSNQSESNNNKTIFETETLTEQTNKDNVESELIPTAFASMEVEINGVTYSYDPNDPQSFPWDVIDDTMNPGSQVSKLVINLDAAKEAEWSRANNTRPWGATRSVQLFGNAFLDGSIGDIITTYSVASKPLLFNRITGASNSAQLLISDQGYWTYDATSGSSGILLLTFHPAENYIGDAAPIPAYREATNADGTPLVAYATTAVKKYENEDITTSGTEQKLQSMETEIDKYIKGLADRNIDSAQKSFVDAKFAFQFTEDDLIAMQTELVNRFGLTKEQAKTAITNYDTNTVLTGVGQGEGDVNVGELVTKVKIANVGVYWIDSNSGHISFEPDKNFISSEERFDSTITKKEGLTLDVVITNYTTHVLDENGNFVYGAVKAAHEIDGGQYDQVHVTYTPTVEKASPVTLNDAFVLGEMGTAINVPINYGQTDGSNNTIDLSSVSFKEGQGTLSADGKTLTVNGEGTWTVNASGQVTFTAEKGFTSDPTPVKYTATDELGYAVTNDNQEATITVKVTPITTVPSYTFNNKGKTQRSDENDNPNLDYGHTLAEMFFGIPSDWEVGYALKDADENGMVVIPGEGRYYIEDGVVKFTPEETFKGTATGVTIQVTGLDKTYETQYVPTVVFEDLIVKIDQELTPIEHKVTIRENKELAPGEVKVVQNGSDGYTLTIWRQDNDNGTYIIPDGKQAVIRNGEENYYELYTQTKEAIEQIIEVGPDYTGTYNYTTQKFENYNIIVRLNEDLQPGETKVLQEGKVGITETPHTITIQNGTVISDEEGTSVKTEKQDAIIEVGPQDYGETITQTFEKETPYNVIVKEDPTMDEGTHKIETLGKAGKTEVTYTVSYKNDIVGTPIITETVIEQPVDQVIIVGTKRVHDTDKDTSIEIKKIPYAMEVIYDDTLVKGEVVETPGKPGQVRETITYEIVNGEIIFNTVEEKVSDPVKHTIRIGTKDYTNEFVHEYDTTIHFDTEIIYDETLTAGQQVVDQEGVDGMVHTKVTQPVINGELGKKEITETTVKEVVNKVIRIGTKPQEVEKEVIVATDTTTITETTPPTVRYVYDDTLESGKTKITEGKQGITTHVITTKNGEVITDRTATKQKMVETIITIGTKPIEKEITTQTTITEVTTENAYDTEYIYDDTLESGKTEVVTPGINGKTKTYTEVIDGKVISETTEELTKKQNKVIRIGIKELVKELPVEVIKEVPVEVIKEVPVEKIVEVIKEVPVEVIKEVPVEKIVEVIKEVPVEKIVEVIKEVPVEVIKEVPVEVIKEVPVEKIVEVIKEVPVEVIKEVPVEKIVEVIKEVPVEIIKEVPVEVIKEVPVEVIKEVPVEVIKEVPVEVIKEVPVEIVKEIIR